jgi:50S ribosomal protein L16 3-hydroxylase
MDKTLLGGLTPAQFMRRHWQKEARLVRKAIPGFNGVIDRRALFALAGRDDVGSRLVMRSGGAAGWSLEHGPFRAADFRGLPARDWTLLVQGLDRHLDAAAALIRRFDFIGYARLDDLMISYAVPGGGVGPHFDSYDVFLLQGTGRRRWRIGAQKDLSLRPDLPLKILRRFVAGDAWIVEPGDLLYLPPSVAHDGTAITECTTYSIGFRAPSGGELVERFLQFLPDVLPPTDARYADPDLRPTATPGRVPALVRRRMGAMLRAIRWDAAIVSRFIGCALSEPAGEAVFAAPASPLPFAAFARAATGRGRGARGLHLDRQARMLYDDAAVYLNGEAFAAVAEHPSLAVLADRRLLPADAALPRSTLECLYEAYLSGAVHVGADGVG